MVIDKNTLIADQALKIAQLEYQLERKTDALNGIHYILFSIGGPLNSNVKLFTDDQLGTFWEIQEYVNGSY
jgi:hypothetical protein